MLTTQCYHLLRLRMSALIPLLSLRFTTLDRDRLTIYIYVIVLKEYHGVTISLNIQATELRIWGIHSSWMLLCPIGLRVPKMSRHSSGPYTSDTNHSIGQRISPEEFNIFQIPSGMHPALNWCRTLLQGGETPTDAAALSWRHNFHGATRLFNSFRSQLGTPMWWPNNCGYETGCEAWCRVLAWIALLPRTGCTEISFVPENTKPKQKMVVGLL